MSKKSSSKIKKPALKIKKPVFKEGEVWYLKWIDSYSLSESRWMCQEELETLIDNPTVIEEVGFIVGITDEFVALVGGQCIDTEAFDHRYHRDVLIPFNVIQYARKLIEAPGKPKKAK
jgi:hypothetical protein